MRKENGHSLIELLVVLLIIGIIVTIAVPSMTRANRSYRLHSSAQQIAQALQAAKISSITNNTAHKVIFNIANNSLTASGGTQISLPADVRFAKLSGSVTAPNLITTASSKSGSLTGQKSDSTLAVSFPQGATSQKFEAAFNSRGIPEVAPGVTNWVYLTNADGEMIAVVLTSAGSTEILRLRNGTWQA